jgi:hypothetical protein
MKNQNQISSRVVGLKMINKTPSKSKFPVKSFNSEKGSDVFLVDSKTRMIKSFVAHNVSGRDKIIKENYPVNQNVFFIGVSKAGKYKVGDYYK